MSAFSDQRLLIVSGKGGVGKSTVAAALASRLARQGLKTLVCEVNSPRERIAPLLGRPGVGPAITPIGENLWAVNVEPAEAMREYALMVLRFESIYRAVFENRLVRYFLRFIPSLQELVMLGKILFHLQERDGAGRYRFDRIVVDAPATGHAITFLHVPQVVLDTVPPGPLARDAERMRDLLVDPRTTAAVLVSLPEEMPINETVELARALSQRVRVTPRVVVLNGFIPRRFDPEELRALERHPLLLEPVRAQALRAEQSDEARARLASELGIAVVPVHRQFRSRLDREGLEIISRELTALWEAA